MTKTKKGGATAGAEDKRRTETTTNTKKKKGDGGEASASAAAAVVLRMELHCHGCAQKVRKAIKGAQGVETVRTDVAAGTVTVAGKADPWDLRDRIQARLARRNKPAVDVAFVSQQMPRPPESTVVLNIQLHCQGCTDRIKREAKTIKGVKQVTVDTAKEQLTVKGTMDAKALPDILSAKLKQRVTTVGVTTNKNKDKDKDKDKDKKAVATGSGDNHDDNRAQQGEEEAGAGGAKKKNKNGKRQQQQQQRGDDHDNEMASWMSEEQRYWLQAFSDENPNAWCSLM